MKIKLFLVINLIIPVLICAGCGQGSGAPLTLSDLTSQPGQYGGKTVTIEGIYVHGWEWILLAEGVTFIGEGDFRELKPVGEVIWFAGLMPPEVYEKLYRFESAGAGPQRYGKVRVAGVFETEGDYGHMNAYEYRITASKVKLLDWTPPE